MSLPIGCGHAAFCAGDPCGDHGVCYGEKGSYVCDCDEGYFGHNCQHFGVNPCTTEHVQNCFGHGTCSSHVNPYNNETFLHNCTCQLGLDGSKVYARSTNCQRFWSELCNNPNVCENNGTCIPSTTSVSEFSCSCGPGEFPDWEEFGLSH